MEGEEEAGLVVLLAPEEGEGGAGGEEGGEGAGGEEGGGGGGWGWMVLAFGGVLG